jgi:glycosyltransferase A (GT-A) superfamily protein (DUF2064 family)
VVNRKQNKAILIFSADPAKDLARRGLSRKFSELVRIPYLTRNVTHSADVHVFTAEGCPFSRLGDSLGTGGSFHIQSGTSFGEKLQNAIEHLSDSGYEQIIVIGTDCPEFQSTDIQTAIDKLATHRLVLGPDHRGGCYLIAFHAADRFKLWEIQWQVNTDCLQLQHNFGFENIFLLPTKHDIDSLADVYLLANCKNRFGARARAMLRREWNPQRWIENSSPLIELPTDLQRPRWQLPPPPFLSFSTRN